MVDINRISNRVSSNEGMPVVAWALLGLSGLVTLIRIILALTSGDVGWLETVQVILIALALVYIIVINYPRYAANVPSSRRVTATQPPPSDPPFAHFLSENVGSSPFWFTVRMYVGFTWLTAGIEKLAAPAWRSGVALKGFWAFASTPPTDPTHAAVAYEWYRQLLAFMVHNHWYTWFTWFVILGELFIGLGLLFGVLTGIAAFFGALLNFSFGLAGVAGVNPLLLVLAILIVWAWKVAGYYGLDSVLLPRIGTFWQPGTLFQRGARPAGART